LEALREYRIDHPRTRVLDKSPLELEHLRRELQEVIFAHAS
jgi:hypothetical protein